MPPLPTTTDGDYSSRLLVAPTRITYPFLNSPGKDTTTKIFDRVYEIDRASYTPFAALSTLPNDGPADPADAAAYLLEETEPDLQDDGTQQVRATFGKIPGDQVSSATRDIVRPTPSAAGAVAVGTLRDYTSSDAGSSLGNAYTYGGYVFGGNKVYTRRGGAGALTAPTGGTYTITYKTSTTGALAYNANAATIQGAINGLASVIADGITVTASGPLSTTGRIQLTLTAGSTGSRFVLNAGSLTPSACAVGFNVISSSIIQLLNVGSVVSIAAHGFPSSGTLIANNGSADSAQSLLPYGTHWAVVDANTLVLNYDLVPTFSYVGVFYRNYTPGTQPTVLRVTDKFYLPGVAPTTTVADIPAPQSLLNDASFLDAILATTSGYLTYTVGERRPWRGPIYQQTTVEIDALTL